MTTRRTTARRRFAPRWWAVVAWALVTLAMLGLGRWQLERADEKIALMAAAAAARGADPVDLATIDDPVAAAEAYRRTRVSGRWLTDRQFLWDNRAHGGRPGLEVVTPLLLDGGRAVLVNRGWVPLPATRSVLPDVRVPSAADVPAPVELVGLASRPSRGFAGGDALVADAPWPRWLQYFDYDAVADALGVPVLPFVLQPERGGPAGVALLAENWQPTASGPEKHWSYAVQWFSMAAALTVLFVYVNLRRPGGEPTPSDVSTTSER